MKLFKLHNGVVIENNQGEKFFKPLENWDSFLNRDNLYELLQIEIVGLERVEEGFLVDKIQAPIQSQEVWAAGVTYLRSRDARKEESKDSGGATFYDLVYDAERPEIFFKATAQRTVGTNQKVRIRKDSTWNVPEPELTLVISTSGKIIGYTVGNDMSSRSIEGENPLYLPQAKVYEKCAGLGPCIYITDQPIPSDTKISITISRNNEVKYQDSVAISQMKRKHQELVGYLFRECEFPNGCFLMTGTCMVPPNDFTLNSNDEINISIDHIGTLTNIVE